MKLLIFAVSVFILLCSDSFSQFRLKEDKGTLSLKTDAEFFHGESKAGGQVLPYIFYSLFVVNPMLVIEDKKAYFGLTKEISAAYFPYGRIGFEYSYIFRSANTSHLRISYNYDIILEAGGFAAFTLAPGAGYFTDTKNKGWFGQLSFGVIIPGNEVIALNPYLKYRFTYVNDKPPGKTNINDISLGMGFIFFLNTD